MDIAAGMKVLHGKDIIHRDLNTNNVLVTFMKEEGRLVAKICDFGLARKLRKNHEDRVNSSFLMTSPNTMPNASYATNPYKKRSSKHKSHNSMPPVLASASFTSLAGANRCNGMTTPEQNRDLSQKYNSRRRKRKSSPPAASDMSSLNITEQSAPLPPPPSEFADIPELTSKYEDSLDLDRNSLGGTLNLVEAGNSLDALTTECGTVAYMAPELLEHLNITKHFTYAKENLVLYTKSIDVYSFGLILWELCTEQVLYEELDDLREVREFVLSGKRPHIPSYILGTYAGLMKDCWSQSPLHRPGFDEIVSRLQVMLGINRNKSDDNSFYNWTLVDAMRESGKY